MNPRLVVGNWKMNGTLSESYALARAIAGSLSSGSKRVDVVLAPPYTALHKVREAIAGSDLLLAGQNAHWQASGAFTGEVSPEMLRDAGCTFVILGHSERRHIFRESDQIVAQKVRASLDKGLRPVLCVGETLYQRRTGITSRVISRQLRAALKGASKNDIGKIEIAYEPVWAIGTGRNATPGQISQVHRRIRNLLIESFGNVSGRRIRILYGGSVKPDNAAELVKTQEVNGLLVGGASLKAETFLSIVRCFNGA
jgi:triosephosphate isomerase (TIM)